MNDSSDSKNSIEEEAGSKIRPDLEAEEYRDGEYYKPISTREYFRVLGYCVIALAVVGVCIALFFNYSPEL